MAKYELSDAQVDNLLALLEEANDRPQQDNELAVLAKILQEQKPIPLPIKKLALIEDQNAMEFCLLHPEDGTPWFGPTNHPVNLGSWLAPGQLPKNFNVLFEGIEP